MLLRAAMLKSARDGIWCRLGLTRVPPAVAQPVPLDGRLVDPTASLSAPPPTLLPELGLDSNINSFEINLPGSYVGESMELAVPKRKGLRTSQTAKLLLLRWKTTDHQQVKYLIQIINFRLASTLMR